MSRPHTHQRTRTTALLTALSGVLLLSACGTEEPPAAEAFDWRLPAGFPAPRVPEDNPMTAAKVELGRHLFYEKRMSGNQTQSCGSCHLQRLAFTDGKPRGIGSTGEVHPRGSMALVNVGYASTYTWGNPLLTTLEEQALGPMFGESPVELGMSGREEELLRRLRDDDAYPARFRDAFPDDPDPISVKNITRALAAFQRTLISGRSPFDRFMYGDERDALSPAARRGMDLFFSERLECFHCHGGIHFMDSSDHAGKSAPEVAFHNNGLYNLDPRGAYPEGGQGVYEISGKDADRGRFKAPTLRNIAVTAPYMHDGSIATLEAVVDHYARGGTLTTSGPNIGDGAKNPNRSGLITGFVITPEERADLVAFLNSLTDQQFLTDPRFSDPFEESP